MKLTILNFIFFTSMFTFAQNNVIGEFEPEYFVDESKVWPPYLDLKYCYVFEQNNNFTLTAEWSGSDELRNPEKTNGVFKCNNDTLILITPVLKSYIEKISENVLAQDKFIFHVKNYYAQNSKNYINKLSFYFIDDNFNSKRVMPKAVETKFDDKKANNEIILSFEILKGSLYFSQKSIIDNDKITLDINDIAGKEFTLLRNYKHFENDNVSYGNPERYFDLTLNKFLIKRKGKKLKALNKKQLYGGVIFKKS